MIIILDSNIFISALIKDSTTRKLITKSKEPLVIPEYFFQEVRKHEKDILSKSGLKEEDYHRLLYKLLQYILIIPNEIISPFKKEALEIVKDIDIDDALFVACALAFPNSIIWSDDKKLKEQNKINILNTKEIIDLFEI